MRENAQRMNTESLLTVGKVVSIEVVERLQRQVGQRRSLFVVDVRAACQTGPPSRDPKALDQVGRVEKVEIALVEEAHFGERLGAEEEARARQARGLVEVAGRGAATADDLSLFPEEGPGPRVRRTEREPLLLAPISRASARGEHAQAGLTIHAGEELDQRRGVWTGVVVQDPHESCASLEGQLETDVVSACISEVRSGLDDLQSRSPTPKVLLGAVGRAVVDNEDLCRATKVVQSSKAL